MWTLIYALGTALAINAGVPPLLIIGALAIKEEVSQLDARPVVAVETPTEICK